ncbi:hypothetical protein [Bradyrhizobium sp. Leo121]|uniref:hypothetical protein n=1 Tax=Bradyrhizobium sp. Leo121 TaxID=1571195 RepID=UPI001028D88B|nr:hypothetical protein [Bradyrhizobium sp. Leo121]RZN21942.1 hypothetical protein CWO90_32525 [Bradyrhizobium sp. Leo121]
MLPIAAPITRILLRYVVGAWVAKAGLAIDVNDPNIFEVANFVVAGFIGLLTEGWWTMARRRGWHQ